MTAPTTQLVSKLWSYCHVVIARASVLPTILISVASAPSPPSPAADPQMGASEWCP